MGAIGNTLDPSNHSSPIGAVLEPIDKVANPLSWATGGKWAEWENEDIPRFANQALSPITQTLGKVDQTINPLRQIPAVNNVMNVAESKPADTIGLAVGSMFTGGALGGALGGSASAAGSGTAGMVGSGAADAGLSASALSAGTPSLGLTASAPTLGFNSGMAFNTGIGSGLMSGSYAGSSVAAPTTSWLSSLGAGAGDLNKALQAGNAINSVASGGASPAPMASAPMMHRSASGAAVPSPMPMMSNPSGSMIPMPGANSLPSSTSSYQTLLNTMLANSMQPPTTGLVGAGTSGSFLPGAGGPMNPAYLIPGMY